MTEKLVVVSRKLLPLLQTEVVAKMDGVSFTIDPRLSSMTSNNRDVTLCIPTTEFNYFCFNKQNRITCWPMSKGDQPINENGLWVKEGRQEMKPGRFFLSFASQYRVYDPCGETVNDKATRDRIIARGAELFASRIQGSNEELLFEISEHVSSVYQTQEHELSHYLTNSCMRPNSGHGCRHHSGYYETIPGLRIVHKKIAGRLLFRALLWQTKCAHTEEEITFLDRIYGTESVNFKLIEHAQENGWGWRRYGDSTIIHKQNSVSLIAPISKNTIEYLEQEGSPYSDTMQYLYRTSNEEYFLSNDYELRRRLKYTVHRVATIQECCGSTFEIYPRCEICNCTMIPAEGAVVVDGYTICIHCYEQKTSECTECGDRHLTNEMFKVHKNLKGGATMLLCESCKNDLDVHYCHDCNAYYMQKHMFYHPETGHWYCLNCKSLWPVCAHCGIAHPREYFHRMNIDGVPRKDVCDSCRNYYTLRCSYCASRISGILYNPYVFSSIYKSDYILCDSCKPLFIGHSRLPRPKPLMVDMLPNPKGWDMTSQLSLDFQEVESVCEVISY